MATYTPEVYHVHNEFDSLGILLDLQRLSGEDNASYKRRLMDVFAHRANATKLGLIHGITRELGLDIYHAMTITPVLDSEGETVGTNPAVVFDETKCYVYSDYTLGEDGLEATLDRYEPTGSSIYYTYSQLLTGIAATGIFACSIKQGVDESTRAMSIFDQSSIKTIDTEDISSSGSIVNLSNRNLLSNYVSISSDNLKERVSSQALLLRKGQYYIDYSNGIIYTTEVPSPGSVIRYKYREDNFKVWASPVIIHNLQSDDFGTKMFEQIESESDTISGAPTEVGADIVTELQSVHPLTLGP